MLELKWGEQWIVVPQEPHRDVWRCALYADGPVLTITHHRGAARWTAELRDGDGPNYLVQSRSAQGTLDALRERLTVLALSIRTMLDAS